MRFTRADIDGKFYHAIEAARAEYNGMMWLLERGAPMANCAYNAETGRFAIAWDRADLLAEFPYPFDAN